jgi:hypothetical protein
MGGVTDEASGAKLCVCVVGRDFWMLAARRVVGGKKGVCV